MTDVVGQDHDSIVLEDLHEKLNPDVSVQARAHSHRRANTRARARARAARLLGSWRRSSSGCRRSRKNSSSGCGRASSASRRSRRAVPMQLQLQRKPRCREPGAAVPPRVAAARAQCYARCNGGAPRCDADGDAPTTRRQRSAAIYSGTGRAAQGPYIYIYVYMYVYVYLCICPYIAAQGPSTFVYDALQCVPAKPGLFYGACKVRL
jgi:hypothetical protein